MPYGCCGVVTYPSVSVVLATAMPAEASSPAATASMATSTVARRGHPRVLTRPPLVLGSGATRSVPRGAPGPRGREYPRGLARLSTSPNHGLTGQDGRLARRDAVAVDSPPARSSHPVRTPLRWRCAMRYLLLIY